MKKWEFSFPPVSKEQWLYQIKKDLKQVPIDSLQADWNTKEKIDPFLHAEDLNGDFVSLPDHYFLMPPVIAEWIDCDNHHPDILNTQILNALKYDTRSIICRFSRNDILLTEVLKEVQLGMIDVSIQPAFDMKIDRSLPAGVNVRIERGNTSSIDFIRYLQEGSQMTSGHRYVIYNLPESDSWIEDATLVFLLILEDLTNWPHDIFDFLKNCKLIFKPGIHYLKQIVQIRALQIVWLNLLTTLCKNEVLPSPLECHIVPHQVTDPDKYLIQLSSSALASSLCGVNSICIHHLEENNVPDFYKRIDRNVQHLLHLESGMYKGKDPISGSYSLDAYAKKLATAIWEKVGGVDVKNFRQNG